MTLQIQLPDELSDYIRRRAADLGYKDPAEYVAAVLASEKQRHLSRDIDQMLLDVLDGPFEPWDDADLDQIRRAGERIIEARGSR